MPDINFRLTATDEASAVLDKTRAKMEQFNKSYGGGGTGGTSGGTGGGRTFGGMPGGIAGGTAAKPGGGAGAGNMAGMLGQGMIGSLAGLTIIGGAVLGVLKKSYDLLAEASPYLKSVGEQFQTALNIFLRPLGDSLAKALNPMSEYAIEEAEAMAEFVESADEQFGLFGAAIATLATYTYMQAEALTMFSIGIGQAVLGWFAELFGALYNAFSTVASIIGEALWAGFESAGDMFLDAIIPLADWLGDATAGIEEWLENMVDTIGSALGDFGGWLWNTITGMLGNDWGILTGLGTWIWDAVTGVFDTAWTFLSGLGTDIFNNIWNALSGIGTEAYKAIHNALAAIINAIRTVGFTIPILNQKIDLSSIIGAVPMLDVGGTILQTGAAIVHKGERVLTAEQTKALNGGMSPAGNTLNVYGNIYGVDDLERTLNELMARQQSGYASYR